MEGKPIEAVEEALAKIGQLVKAQPAVNFEVNMVKSKQPMSSARSLKGYIIIMKRTHWTFEHTPLVLGFSPPTHHIRTWGFDWFHRGTVFRTKSAARWILNKLDDKQKRRSEIVPLKDWAILIPEVDSRCKLYFKPSSKHHRNSTEERVKERHFAADRWFQSAARQLRVAKMMRKQALILAAQE